MPHITWNDRTVVLLFKVKSRMFTNHGKHEMLPHFNTCFHLQIQNVKLHCLLWKKFGGKLSCREVLPHFHSACYCFKSIYNVWPIWMNTSGLTPVPKLVQWLEIKTAICAVFINQIKGPLSSFHNTFTEICLTFGTGQPFVSQKHDKVKLCLHIHISDSDWSIACTNQ